MKADDKQQIQEMDEIDCKDALIKAISPLSSYKIADNILQEIYFHESLS